MGADRIDPEIGGAATMAALPSERPGVATTPMQQLAKLERGASIGRYIVIEAIGAGGMGIVFAAFDPELGRKVAVKVVSTDLGGSSATRGRDRLLREAQAMAQLAHPNVIHVYDVGTFGADVFLAMELRSGVNLSEWLDRSKRTWREVLDVMVQAGRGLAAAHAVGLVHRDFKPDNVHVGDDGRVCVLDFGLARPAAATEEPVTASAGAAAPAGKPVSRRLNTPVTEAGAIAGTPHYMAPEQYRGVITDARTDQFGFCVALHEALFGERPFEGDNLAQLGEAIAAGKMRPPPKDREVPGWLRALLARGMSVRPEDRYPSMDALLADVERHTGRRRGRLAAAIAAAGVAGVAAVLITRATAGSEAPDQLEPCRGAGDQIAAVWSPERAAEVRAKIAATPVPWAADTADRVVRGLDAWSGRWRNVRREACLATHVRAERSESALAQIETCLDRRQLDLDALARVLAGADKDVVERAAAAVADLPRPESCANLSDLNAPPQPPPGSATELEAVARKLAEAKALHDGTGRYTDSLVAARAALAGATAVGYPPDIAEARFWEGRALGSSGDAAGAVASLEEAMTAAIASRMDQLAIRAAAYQIGHVGAELDRAADGHAIARRAAAMAQGNQDGLGAARIEFAEGMLLRIEARYDDARAALEHAIPILERHPDTELEVAHATNQLASAHLQSGDYAGALPLFEKAIAIRERKQGAEHPQVASLLINVGVTHTHLGHFEQALATLARAHRVLQVKLGPDHPNLAKLLNNIGLTHAKQRRWAEALPYHQQALAMFERLKQADAVAATATLINLAYAERMMGRFDESLAHDQRTLAIYEKAHGRDHPDLAYPLDGIGEALVMRGQPAQAIPPLLRGLALREKHQVDPEERGHIRFMLARALWDSGRDRRRALALATQARDDYLIVERTNPTVAPERAAIDTWLAQNRP